MSFDKKNNIFDAKTKKELEKRESKYLKKINNIKNFFNLDKFMPCEILKLIMKVNFHLILKK